MIEGKRKDRPPRGFVTVSWLSETMEKNISIGYHIFFFEISESE
jgi:hypothetical protein